MNDMTNPRPAKKVLFATYTCMPDIGGVATATHNLCVALVEAGHDVKVVTLTRDALTDLGYDVIARPSYRSLIELYRESDVVLFNNTSIRLAWPSIVFGNKSYGLFHHSETLAEISGSNEGLKRWFSNYLANRSRHYLASNYLKRSLQELLFGLQLEVIYPIARVTPLGQNLDQYSKRGGVLFAGRLVREKGVAFIIENWPKIRELLHVEKLTIVGDGPDRQAITDAAAAHFPQIELVGKMSPDKVLAKMRDAAYVIVPSVWAEPFGIVGVEGIAAGAVVIASNRGGLSEAVGQIGVTFDLDDPSDFSAALSAARKNRETITSSEAEFQNFVEQRVAHLEQFTARRALDTLSPLLNH